MYTPTTFTELEMVADRHAGAGDMVPKPFRNNPDACLVAIMAGQALGWSAWESLQSIQMIAGQAALKPQAMLALVREAGHRVEIIRGDREATVNATRSDTGETMTETWSLDREATQAGLAYKDNWKQYPVDMCQWRAVGVVARALFPDVLAGMSYVAEELGEATDPKGALPTVESTGTPLMLPRKEVKCEILRLVEGDVVLGAELWEKLRPGNPEFMDELEVTLLMMEVSEELDRRGLLGDGTGAPVDDTSETKEVGD